MRWRGVEFDAGINESKEIGMVQKDRIMCNMFVSARVNEQPLRFMFKLTSVNETRVNETKVNEG